MASNLPISRLVHVPAPACMSSKLHKAKHKMFALWMDKGTGTQALSGSDRSVQLSSSPFAIEAEDQQMQSSTLSDWIAWSNDGTSTPTWRCTASQRHHQEEQTWPTFDVVMRWNILVIAKAQKGAHSRLLDGPRWWRRSYTHKYEYRCITGLGEELHYSKQVQRYSLQSRSQITANSVASRQLFRRQLRCSDGAWLDTETPTRLQKNQKHYQKIDVLQMAVTLLTKLCTSYRPAGYIDTVPTAGPSGTDKDHPCKTDPPTFVSTFSRFSNALLPTIELKMRASIIAADERRQKRKLCAIHDLRRRIAKVAARLNESRHKHTHLSDFHETAITTPELRSGCWEYSGGRTLLFPEMMEIWVKFLENGAPVLLFAARPESQTGIMTGTPFNAGHNGPFIPRGPAATANRGTP
ncbi:hypothetical protein BJ508DRAFT_313267 [Ascobolus immersus RN42]|uniref:Uncharacterized protein n=1 Tax=Ascobolus immersus RN42 TaxID=1160509 RepID=A0A3N4HJJ0_ASCIM|nr:hypothetical protein BJ508DRAFT_313267 [Ascobolus immersus RN42]